MSRRAFVVAGIVECLQPDRGGWELIDSHRPYLICDPDTDPDRPNRGGVGMLHLVWQPDDCTW